MKVEEELHDALYVYYFFALANGDCQEKNNIARAFFSRDQFLGKFIAHSTIFRPPSWRFLFFGVLASRSSTICAGFVKNCGSPFGFRWAEKGSIPGARDFANVAHEEVLLFVLCQPG